MIDFQYKLQYAPPPPNNKKGDTNRRFVAEAGVYGDIAAPTGLKCQGRVSSSGNFGNGHGGGSSVGDEWRGEACL